ncbi:11614_t:CDS:1, partial [Funneliformis mosseae]
SLQTLPHYENASHMTTADFNNRPSNESLYLYQQDSASNAQNAETMIPIHSLQFNSNYQASLLSLSDYLINSQEGVYYLTYANTFSFGSVIGFPSSEDRVQGN